MVFLNMPDLIAAGSAGLDDIAVVEEKVDQVIKLIEVEQEKLLPVAFAFGALIQAPSFGGADSASNLALHYSKAHEVTWKTLRGVKEDLLDYQRSLRDAKTEIIKADESAGDRVRIITTALEGVASSTQGRHGRRAREEARRDANQGGES